MKKALARIQAFTFSSQDHGRLFDKHISKHSRWRHSQDHGRLNGEHISEHSLFSWRRHSQVHGRLWCVLCVHVVLCVVCCFLCVHVVLCRCVCCVVVWCCVVLACCREHVVVLVVRVCGCWCVVVFGVRCGVCVVWCVCETTHGGVLDTSTGRGEGGRALSLSSFLSLLLSLLRSLPPFLFSSLLSSFLLFSSLLSSLLFPSRPQTLYKTRINQHGVQLRGVIWRELHSTSFSARHVVTHVTILPSSPLPLLHHHHHHHLSLPERGNFLLQEYFRRRIYLIWRIFINSEKSPPGKITVITVLY